MHFSAPFKQFDVERSLDHKCNPGIIFEQFLVEPKTIHIVMDNRKRMNNATETMIHSLLTIMPGIHYILAIFDIYCMSIACIIDSTAYYTRYVGHVIVIQVAIQYQKFHCSMSLCAGEIHIASSSSATPNKIKIITYELEYRKYNVPCLC